MTNFSLVLLYAWWSMMVNNPYMMSVIFGQVLFMMTCVMGTYSKFMGLILFLVYVGGIMILVSYCVMLTSTDKIFTPRTRPFLLIGVIGSVILGSMFSRAANSFVYGLLYSASALFLAGLLLYFVMLAVLEIVDYSGGAML